MKLAYRSLFILVLCLVTLPSLCSAATDTRELFIEKQLDQLGITEIEEFWRNVHQEYNGFLPESQPLGLKDFFLTEESLFSVGLLKGFVKFIFHELWVNGKLLSVIIMLTVFSMLLEHIQSAFENNSVSKVAYTITYLVIFIIAINSFSTAIHYAQEAIANMVHLMLSLIPLILALMASVGNIASVSLFHPLIIFLVNFSGLLVYSVVFPLLFFSAILTIISSFSEQYKVTQLADVLKNVALGLLGAFFTIFLGVVSVQGASSAVVDGITIKTAKYVTGNLVPVVGKLLTDATDTVIGASLLVKNTIGLAGVFMLLVLAIFPAIKIVIIALIYHLSAALLQPLGDSSVIACLQGIGKSLLFVFAALASVSLMFFLAITIIIASGNLSVMVR